MTRLKKWLPDIALIVLLLAARSSLADHYHVPSGSMEFTLLPGDRVVVDKTAYGIEFPFLDFDVVEGDAPRAGEIAIFDSPSDGRRLIKRIVAVGGDRVALRDGRLFLNGRSAGCDTSAPRECFGDRVARLNLAHGTGPDIAEFTVPPGKVLAIGDARGNSHDSRHYGLVDTSELYGRAVAVYYRRNDGLGWRAL